MSDEEQALSDLKAYLATVAEGPLDESDRTRVEQLLSTCWEAFEGYRDTNIAGWKLHGRTEAMEWTPPKLSFCLERHGATVQGSSRAELHTWDVNIDTKIASVTRSNCRQMFSRDKPLNVVPLVEEIGQAILERQEDERLDWISDGRVRIRIAEVIPETVKQTTAARRKRFREGLREVLEPLGWGELRPKGSALRSSGCS